MTKNHWVIVDNKGKIQGETHKNRDLTWLSFWFSNLSTLPSNSAFERWKKDMTRAGWRVRRAKISLDIR